MQWIKQKLSLLNGAEAEHKACQYLLNKGLVLLSKNYRCRRGEIDLIMREGAELVFIEVKFRANQSHGRAEEFFHVSKRKKFESAIYHYMQNKQLNPAHVPHRIDVVAINQQEVTWLQRV